MLKFTENFSMTFAENRTYGVPKFAGTEVNRHSGKLKGLSGYLQNHHDTKGLSRASSSSGVSQDPIFLLNFFEQQPEQKIQHHNVPLLSYGWKGHRPYGPLLSYGQKSAQLMWASIPDIICHPTKNYSVWIMAFFILHFYSIDHARKL